ncbi:MAG TPA: hypothetical protein VGM97_06505 [Steroidobacteraceae bacterium]|jgi:hypothetical protein
MMTPLNKTLKRSLVIDGIDYVITLSPEALRLTQRGKRLGLTLKWADMISGDSALAVALQASVGRLESPEAGK